MAGTVVFGSDFDPNNLLYNNLDSKFRELYHTDHDLVESISKFSDQTLTEEIFVNILDDATERMKEHFQKLKFINKEQETKKIFLELLASIEEVDDDSPLVTDAELHALEEAVKAQKQILSQYKQQNQEAKEQISNQILSIAEKLNQVTAFSEEYDQCFAESQQVINNLEDAKQDFENARINLHAPKLKKREPIPVPKHSYEEASTVEKLRALIESIAIITGFKVEEIDDMGSDRIIKLSMHRDTKLTIWMKKKQSSRFSDLSDHYEISVAEIENNAVPIQDIVEIAKQLQDVCFLCIETQQRLIEKFQ